MQKLTSLFFVLLCFTAATSSVLGQPATTPVGLPEAISKIIPPSPTAASLGKYGDIPVSMYTGTPNIDIPLHTLKCGELSLPISLSYHASGVKVDKIKSIKYGSHPIRGEKTVEICGINGDFKISEDIKNIADVTHIKVFNDSAVALKYKNKKLTSILTF